MQKKDLSILMIGNSFSICVGKNLPQMVRSVPGCTLHLTSAYIGGCPLERHSMNLKLALSDPEYKPYEINIWDSTGRTPDVARVYSNVNELLLRRKYDIITIQQASPKSWDLSTYQPYADEVIGFIRQYQKDAEIVVQQTWAYRCDAPQLQPNPGAEWDFDQTGMYERLNQAYREFARSKKFRLIPTGDAVQTFRRRTPVTFKADTRLCNYPDLPSTAGEAVGKAAWRQDSESGEWRLAVDFIHLNPVGEYLQSCVWFQVLYGEPVSKIAYDDPALGSEMCAFLRECAAEALKQFRQP